MNPAARCSFGKPGLDFHAVGQELFHLSGRGTQQTRALVIFDQVNIDRVKAGRRFIGGLVGQFSESGLRQRELLRLDPQVARIEHFGFNGQTFEIGAPAPLFHHQPDVNFIPWPIHTALGENERVKPFRREVLRAFNLKAREIQDAVFARERHERDVVAITRDKCHRCFFALRFLDRRKGAMTIHPCCSRLDRHAVLAQNLNGSAVERLAVLDRH